MTFERHHNCIGCGLCTITSDRPLSMNWENGFLYPSTDSDINKWECSLKCNPHTNETIDSYFAYHKNQERRMDGSAGGIYGAIIESMAKDGSYFTGTVYDEQLKVKYILTNDPEKIKSFSGYKPTQGNAYSVFPQIKELLDCGKTVVFTGLPCQCHSLNLYLKKNYNNLVVIDVVCQGTLSQDLVTAYASDIEKDHHSRVVDIRFCNKEFSNVDSKRITLQNGRVIYIKQTDSFDRLARSGNVTRRECKECLFTPLKKRIGDITVGYCKKGIESDDGLGVSYLSVNTQKGKAVLDKSRKRIVIIKENVIGSTEENFVLSKLNCANNDVLQGDCVSELYKKTNAQQKKVSLYLKIRKVVSVLSTLRKVSRLHIKPITQFVKINFFTKGVETDLINNGFIYVAPYTEFMLEKNIHIKLMGPLKIGTKRVPTSKLETRVRMRAGSSLIIKDRADIGNGSNIEIYKNAKLEIGEMFSNAPIVIICGEHIKMGSPVNIARGSTIRDTNGHQVIITGYKTTRPVDIGNHVWICSDSTVMPGVKIGDGAIIGACSYVCQKVPSFTLVQGNPAIKQANPQYFIM